MKVKIEGASSWTPSYSRELGFIQPNSPTPPQLPPQFPVSSGYQPWHVPFKPHCRMLHSVIDSSAEACLKQMVGVCTHTQSLSLIIQMRAKLEMHILEYAGFTDPSCYFANRFVYLMGGARERFGFLAIWNSH